jgi:phosphoserine aminotransferase
MAKRIHNFNAGPAVLPLPVLEEAQEHLVDFHGQGHSLMEMSHRGKTYDAVHTQTIADMREVMHISDDYEVIFMQGGASLQFAAVPLNLAPAGGKVLYADTGSWSTKAMQEASKLGYAMQQVAGSGDAEYTYIPTIDAARLDKDAAYLHITSNNTIRGTQYHSWPATGDLPLVADMSSDINCRVVDIDKFGLIYAGAQKNMGPSGVTIVIMRKELLARSPKNIPSLTNYATIAGKQSLYNTPPTFAIYLIGLVLKWIAGQGGLPAIEKTNRQKAAKLYALIDGTDFYRGTARVEDRSLMNVTFRLPSEDLEKRFVAEATEADMIGLKGHRSVGGCRASIYNASSLADVEALVDFMGEFERRNG